MDEGDTQLTPCRCCGRNFRPDVLNKHEPICIKSNKKQRKIFDSGKQRATGSDIPINKTLKPGEIPKTDPKLAVAEAKTKQWRQKHEQLINSLKAARNYSLAKSTGGPLPPAAPAVIDPSLVQCPYCQRRFNEDACKRHVSFCKEQQAKLGPRPVGKKQIYKAPPLKPKQQIPPPRSASIATNGNDSQSSMMIQNTSTRSGLSSNLPVKSVKSNLPTRNVVGRPQASPTIVQVQPTKLATGNHRAGSYNSPAPRGSIKPTSTTPTISTSSSVRKPVVGTNVNNKAAGFCHECGASFSVSTARFCSECGVRRLAI